MKLTLNLVVFVFLLFGLAACNQENASKGVKKTSTSTQTSQNSNSTSSSPTQNEQTKESNTPNTQNESTNPNQVPVTLVNTVDGDTIKVNYNGKEETVRYLLVDTPEEKKPRTCVQPYAMDAYNRNKQLVSSGNLFLEFEEKNKIDKYGRLLAYVFVNGTSVQESLLKEGFARVAYIYYPPYKYLSLYESDESIAKSQNLNIWSKPGYATANGFNGCVDSSTGSTSTGASSHTNASVPSLSTSSGSSGSEFFANCTELRKKYPDGVPKGHPAYQDKLDRDKDGFACEK